MVTTRPPKTIVKPTALGPVANTDTKLLIYGLFQKRPSFGTGRAGKTARSAPKWPVPSINSSLHEIGELPATFAMTRTLSQSVQILRNSTQNTRSTFESLGRFTERRRTASCCRRATFSRASSRRALKAEIRARTNDEIMPAWCRQAGD